MEQNQTTSMPANLAAAFVKAQGEFTSALKNGTNPDFNSKYADLESVVNAIKEGLKQNKIAVMQRGVQAPAGYAAIETIFIHESGEVFSCGIMQAPLPTENPQGYGSAVTYLRRYSLQAACGIPSADDDGAAASLTAGQQSAQTMTITQVAGATDVANAKAILLALAGMNKPEVELLNWLKTSAKSVSELSPAEAFRASKSLGIKLPVDETTAEAAPVSAAPAAAPAEKPAPAEPAKKVASGSTAADF